MPQVDVFVENLNFAKLRIQEVNISFLYEGERLGSVDASNLALGARSSSHKTLNAHLYTASPLVVSSLALQLTLQGYIPLNYTGDAQVQYLGISASIDLSGTKNASVLPLMALRA